MGILVLMSERPVPAPSLPVCPVCGRQARERVHAGCARRVQEELDSLPLWYGRLGGILAPGSGPVGERVSGGSGFGSRVPLRLDPLVLRVWGGGSLPSTLLAYENRWRARLGWEGAPFRGSAQETVEGCVKFLSVNLTWALDSYDAVSTFAGVVHQLVADCRLLVEGPSEMQRVGACPAVVDDGGPCLTVLYAHPYAEAISCWGCGASWVRNDWLKLARLLRACDDDS